jgi:hypothetical protein
LDKALPVDSSESGSSQSAGTTFVPDADEPIMSAAFVSIQDRRSRLTSLLHHLTVDPEAPDQELPIAGLPAMERSRNAGAVTRRARTGWQSARLFVVTGVTAALIGWGMVLLPGARKAATETVQAESPPPPVATKVLSATEVPPLIRDSLPQEIAEPSGAANAATLVHDSLPQVHDSRAQDDIPPLPAAETSRDQAPKPQLPQSVGSSQVLDADEIAALVKRGKDFANHGDLVSARLLFRRAAEAGSADAAQALGETFDPVVFQRLHVIGIEPDAARAQKWYQRAAELRSAVPTKPEAPPQPDDEARKTEIPHDETTKMEIPQSSQRDDEAVIKKAKTTIAAKMRDPDSVQFEEMERAARKNALGKSIDTICGFVRDKTGGSKPFLYLIQKDEAYIGGYTIATSEYRNICSITTLRGN